MEIINHALGGTGGMAAMELLTRLSLTRSIARELLVRYVHPRRG